PPPRSHPLSLHDALPIYRGQDDPGIAGRRSPNVAEMIPDEGPFPSRALGGLRQLYNDARVGIVAEIRNHDSVAHARPPPFQVGSDRKSTRLNSSHVKISY